MKSYQKVLKNISWSGVAIGLALGIFTGIRAMDRHVMAREARASWCLDAGGRTVQIDFVNGCFALTQVPIDSEFFGRSEQILCTENPNQVWIRVSGGPSACYTFERLTQENPE